MTDTEADAWFETHATYEEVTSIGYTTYALKRKGGAMDERVGFVKPTTFRIRHPPT